MPLPEGPDRFLPRNLSGPEEPIYCQMSMKVLELAVIQLEADEYPEAPWDPFFPCQSNPWVLWATLTGMGGEHLSLGLIRE